LCAEEEETTLDEESTERLFISSCGSLHGGESWIRGDGPSKVLTTLPIVTGNMFISPLINGEISSGLQISIAYALELTRGEGYLPRSQSDSQLCPRKDGAQPTVKKRLESNGRNV
jgi:hypothetical protein